MARRHLVATLEALPEPRAVPEGVTVRHPSPPDAEVLATLMLDAYAGTIDADGSETLDDARREVAGYLAGASGEPMLEASHVAEVEGSAVSAVLVSHFDGVPLIAYAFTAAAHRGRGLSSALMTLSLRALRDRGERRVHLWVTAGNADAEHIYKCLGFTDAPD